MFTEDEAKTKWCPMFRSAVAHDVMGGANYATNRDNVPSTGRVDTCIASSCMAWRPVNQWRVRSDYPWQNGTPRGDFIGPNNETRMLGYCGAFGKVEP